MAKKFGKWEYSEEELKRQLAEADKRGLKAEKTEPEVTAVRYDRNSNLIVLNLANGAAFSFPPNLVEGLADASPSEIADVQILPGGDALRWAGIDIDLGVPELVAGAFGTRAWMAQLGRVGGQVKSKAKAAAARENGKKGGRPQTVIYAKIGDKAKASLDASGCEKQVVMQGESVFQTLFAKTERCIPACVKRAGRYITMGTLVETGLLLQKDIITSLASKHADLKGALLVQSGRIISTAFVGSGTLFPETSKCIKEAEDAGISLVA
jgi:hypothetical protein